jgi:hypothetical protein
MTIHAPAPPQQSGAKRKFKRSIYIVALRHYQFEVECDGWHHDAEQRQYRFFEWGVNADGTPNRAKDATHDVATMIETEVVGVVLRYPRAE